MNATTPPESVNALTLSTIADNEIFEAIVQELQGLKKAETETAQNNAETILDGTLRQGKLISKAKELTDKLEKERRPNLEKFAELIGYSFGMTRKYLDLIKAHEKAEKEGRSIDSFKALNRSVIANGKRPIYGIQAFTDYLNGLDIYRSSIAKEEERAQRKAEKEAEKAEKEAEKEEEKRIKEEERVNELRNSVLKISVVSMNGLIKEDIQVKIYATNNDKPIILSSVRSSELKRAFDIILNLVQKTENETIAGISGKIINTEKEFKAKGEKAVRNKKIEALQNEQASKLALADSLREAMMG